MTDHDDSPKARTAQDAARRALALIAITSRAHEDVAEQSLHWVQESGIEDFFSAQEREFYYLRQKPEDRDILNFSWRAESLVSIIWALGGLEHFPPLDQQVDVWAIQAVQDAINSTEAFIANATLRPQSEIEDMESDLYHQHWRVRDAQLFNKPMPSELNPSVVYERRYGLSWLVGWGDDWDDVPTDT
ncbi:MULTISPECIES: DUF4272 domain-containing protein [unclassified Pseudoxanthomonas]|jgi:hypothetical protein|uniref:DUF4272 domain-containing protein n=1 Tax=unclassified Pseudoxanthomonas TaxID=2645906 RepID=UPI00307D3C5B